MTSYDGTKVMITGAAGVIGRRLTRMLADRGAELLTIDREPLPDGLAGGVEHLQQDLSEMSLAPLREFDPSIIFHLAASFERTEESPDYWDVGWRDDVTASHRVISAARDCVSLRGFVFASSYLVYDGSHYLSDAPPETSQPVPEDANVDPRNLCGAGKYYTERELRYLVDTTRPDVRVVNARIYRVYGQGSRDVISRWVRSLLAGGTIEVFNGSNAFDYVYADDVAEALSRLGATPDAHGVVNVATGRRTSIDEVIAALEDVGLVSAGSVIRGQDQPPYESSLADVERLRRLVGWVPATDVGEGIRRIVDHERRLSDG